MAGLLLFNITDPDRLNKIQITALRMGLEIRCVKKEEYALPLGFLAGTDGFTDEEQDDRESFEEEMLIMCGLTGSEMNELIDTLRRKNVSIALKAVLTETNSKWSSTRLYRELSAERAAFKAMAAMQPPKHGMHRKKK